ncbi:MULTISPECIES: hypothetical protein [unclassified Methylobacterium]|uniref:hypothetical protein n=1 Tax=unclassified Methylobacterium TaxID=2615210 RepID=UPI00226A2D41|nr:MULTISPECIES: hypothetical protein [unclassified Methylobacterium]
MSFPDCNPAILALTRRNPILGDRNRLLLRIHLAVPGVRQPEGATLYYVGHEALFGTAIVQGN